MTGFAARYLNRGILLELAPAGVFFISNAVWGLMAATALVILATLICVVVGHLTLGRTPVLALATLVIVAGLGGASLLLGDASFIKMRPTIGKCLFAAALAGGLMFRQNLLERALATQLSISRRGWRVLTLAWIAIALMCALLNEAARRALTDDGWVAFNTAMSVGSILAYIVVTRWLAPRFWQEGA